MADGQGQPGQMQMPQDPAVQVFANLTQELTNVSQALTARGISNIVLRFDGNPKNYREWIKSIEKYAVLVNVLEARKKINRLSVIRGRCKWVYSEVHDSKP